MGRAVAGKIEDPGSSPASANFFSQILSNLPHLRKAEVFFSKSSAFAEDGGLFRPKIPPHFCAKVLHKLQIR